MALHGCKQNSADIGQQFVRSTGYNRWADTNNIIVLYPQTSQAATNSCWDWWGYDSSHYVDKTGPQMAAIKTMVDRLSGATQTCYTASNYAHVMAGRAYANWLGFAYAKGSAQNMGFIFFVTTTLKQTGREHYVIGTCP